MSAREELLDIVDGACFVRYLSEYGRLFVNHGGVTVNVYNSVDLSCEDCFTIDEALDNIYDFDDEIEDWISGCEDPGRIDEDFDEEEE